ncbi:uncharacterized protein LOC126830586 [Patella vulgata]|uniref:uncharacterized protein LOC126830586 n=1 Tax=Patella vulgata TaxID=6465 RepID=UPI002180928B|nr:uncharacterized protein LOC126830586 [Patella vulgata]
MDSDNMMDQDKNPGISEFPSENNPMVRSIPSTSVSSNYAIPNIPNNLTMATHPPGGCFSSSDHRQSWNSNQTSVDNRQSLNSNQTSVDNRQSLILNQTSDHRRDSITDNQNVQVTGSAATLQLNKDTHTIISKAETVILTENPTGGPMLPFSPTADNLSENLGIARQTFNKQQHTGRSVTMETQNQHDDVSKLPITRSQAPSALVTSPTTKIDTMENLRTCALPKIDTVDSLSTCVLPKITSVENPNGPVFPNIDNMENLSDPALPEIDTEVNLSVPLLPNIETVENLSVPLLPNIETMENLSVPLLPNIDNSETLITDVRLKHIINVCDKLMTHHTKSVQDIITMCSKISGYEIYCNRIVNFCNQIYTETLNGSHSIMNLCKAFTRLDVTCTGIGGDSMTNQRGFKNDMDLNADMTNRNVEQTVQEATTSDSEMIHVKSLVSSESESIGTGNTTLLRLLNDKLGITKPTKNQRRKKSTPTKIPCERPSRKKATNDPDYVLSDDHNKQSPSKGSNSRITRKGHNGNSSDDNIDLAWEGDEVFYV